MGYQYRASGLDNVFLAEVSPNHESGVAGGAGPVEDSAGLHRAIGSWLVASPKPLNGAEIRFLRTEMALTQRGLADLLGTTVQTLRFWEKHRDKEINGAADRLVRILYSEAMSGRDSIRSEMDRLQQGRETCVPNMFLRRTASGWKPVDH